MALSPIMSPSPPDREEKKREARLLGSQVERLLYHTLIQVQRMTSDGTKCKYFHFCSWKDDTKAKNFRSNHNVANKSQDSCMHSVKRLF